MMRGYGLGEVCYDQRVLGKNRSIVPVRKGIVKLKIRVAIGNGRSKFHQWSGADVEDGWSSADKLRVVVKSIAHGIGAKKVLVAGECLYLPEIVGSGDLRSVDTPRFALRLGQG